MMLGDAIQILVLASGWLCAAWLLGERVESALLPPSTHTRRTSPPAILTPRSGLWKRPTRRP